MPEAELIPTGRFEWEKIIRRVVFPSNHRSIKLVAMMLASFADSRTGENARPGEARLAAMCQLGQSTVRASLKWLREEGLIHRVSRGSNLGQSNLVDVYQLCAPSDWESRFPLLPSHGKDSCGLIVRPRRANPNRVAATTASQ
ncbi:hypothetical protein KBX53_00380 [Micromonospora sp. M51]|uniref:hypothetical protein n=1 Tax=Micromonospora sp. M51 TaxID=2824889 RepID=UPI001B360AB6|nr:hypothetical protein [Micromonospora sp. M51]MBQ1009437.1 hypothetical protein [Micromonospora sp. M51]